MQFIDFISCAYDMLTNYVATARYGGLATRSWCEALRRLRAGSNAIMTCDERPKRIGF